MCGKSRFALSYEALKITGTPQRPAMSRTTDAVSTACWALSITHGPAMKTSGCLPPTDRDPIWTGFTALFYPWGRGAKGKSQIMHSGSPVTFDF